MEYSGLNELNLDGFTPVPAGRIATVVTHLEMTAPNDWSRERPTGLDLVVVPDPDPDWYLDLFRRIGSDWLWFSRLDLSHDELKAVLAEPGRVVRAVREDGKDAGLLELNFADPGQAEIAYFGLVPEAVGRGAGAWLMGAALELCWTRPGVRRVWLHTCTLDHPNALPFYLGCGFVPVRREIEIRADPRLCGNLPAEAGRHHPVIAPE